MKYLFEVHWVVEYAADHVKTKFFQSVIQYLQKVLTGIPMTLISFVDVVGCSNLFRWKLCVCACCISNFSLIGKKLWCQCQFEVTLLCCTFQFFLLHMLVGTFDWPGGSSGTVGLVERSIGSWVR
jgi:hypothetical protein